MKATLLIILTYILSISYCFGIPKDSINVEFSIENNGINITLTNKGNGNIYVFKSYLKEAYISSKYLHQIDKKNKLHYLSFIPNTKCISSSLSDRVVLSEEKIISPGQFIYEFDTITPHTSKKYKFDYDILFKNINNDNNAIDRVKLKRSKYKFITTRRLKGQFSYIFEFAIYKDISLIMKKYNINEETESSRIQATKFDVLSYKVPIPLVFFN